MDAEIFKKVKILSTFNVPTCWYYIQQERRTIIIATTVFKSLLHASMNTNMDTSKSQPLHSNTQNISLWLDKYQNVGTLEVDNILTFFQNFGIHGDQRKVFRTYWANYLGCNFLRLLFFVILIFCSYLPISSYEIF